MKRHIKNISFLILVIALVVFILPDVMDTREQPVKLTYSEFLKHVENKSISKVSIQEKGLIEGEFWDHIQQHTSAGERLDGRRFATYSPGDDKLVERLKNNVKVFEALPPKDPIYWNIFLSWFPYLLLFGFFIYMLQKMQGGGGKAMSFGKSKAILRSQGSTRVTFEDVAGIDEATEELEEIIDYLKYPAKFTALGAKIPRGVLLIGPPGTGKTLLARAISGEADVPFYTISGSDFVEMFVGVGAARVRDLFEQARGHAAQSRKGCIVFIDEIDAVGRQRGAGLGGGHDEREQTLNQLLVEMDGFDNTTGIIVIAATNRPDVLDPALLRPGRFDRQVVVHLPDIKGREEILKVHSTDKIPMDTDVDLRVIARGTPNFSGADLANLINESALLAARRDQDAVTMADMEEARDKVMMGPERRSRVISEKERKNTAYHEAGHALVATFLEHCDPLHKVTIIPRGMSAGSTWTLPVEDVHNFSKTQLIDRLTMTLGGRAAEVLVFDDLTTGAGHDMKHATNLVHRMVCEWGMSDELGPMTFGRTDELVFLGRELTRSRDFSESTAVEIDKEIRRVIDGCYHRALDLISAHREELDRLAEVLIVQEVLTGVEVTAVIDGTYTPPPPEPEESLEGEEILVGTEEGTPEEIVEDDEPAFDSEDDLVGAET